MFRKSGAETLKVVKQAPMAGIYRSAPEREMTTKELANPPSFSAKTHLRTAAFIVYTSIGNDNKKSHLKAPESLYRLYKPFRCRQIIVLPTSFHWTSPVEGY